MELVDIVLPVGSDHKYLPDALKSIMNSRDVKTRILLIDNSINGIQDLKQRIRKTDKIFREEKRGFAHSVNAPIMQGHIFENYVAIMNSDDISHPDRFIKQINKLKSTKTDVNLCSVQNIKRGKPAKSFFGSLTYNEYSPLLLALGAYGIEPMWVTTPDWWVKNAFRNTEIHPDIVDLECALRSFPTTKFSTVSEKLYIYRKHSGQMSRNLATKVDFLEIRELASHFFGIYGVEFPSFQTFYSIRPHNVFKEAIKGKDRDILLNYLEVIKNRIFLDITDKKMKNEIEAIIDIRALTLSHFKSGLRYLGISFI
jgi:hypothetical protein